MTCQGLNESLHDVRDGRRGFLSILSPQLLAEKSRNVLLVVRRSMTCQGLNESPRRSRRKKGDFFVVVLNCDCVCLKKCGVLCLEVRIVNESLKGETALIVRMESGV